MRLTSMIEITVRGGHCPQCQFGMKLWNSVEFVTLRTWTIAGCAPISLNMQILPICFKFVESCTILSDECNHWPAGSDHCDSRKWMDFMAWTFFKNWTIRCGILFSRVVTFQPISDRDWIKVLNSLIEVDVKVGYLFWDINGHSKLESEVAFLGLEHVM